MFIEILEIDLDNIFSPPGKARQAALKKTKVATDMKKQEHSWNNGSF